MRSPILMVPAAVCWLTGCLPSMGGEGEPCFNNHTCSQGLSCVEPVPDGGFPNDGGIPHGDHDQPGEYAVCLAAGGPGERCYFDGTCDGDLACNRKTETCVEVGGPGLPCRDLLRCDPGLRCDGDSCCEGSAGGGFREHTQRPLGVDNATEILTADFDKDGIPDLAGVGFQLGNGFDNNVYGVGVIRGTGTGGVWDGGFARASYLKDYIATSMPARMAAADFDSDSVLDIAFSNDQAYHVSFWKGAGDGTFGDAWVTMRQGFARPIGIAVGDYDDDSNPDVAVAEREGGVVALMGTGPFQFEADPLTVIEKDLNWSGTGELIQADLNGDGTEDLVTLVMSGTGPYSADALIRNGGPDGTFADGGGFQVWSVSNNYTTPRWVADDVNRDGVPDFAAVCEGNQAQVFLGSVAGGRWTLQRSIPVDLGAPGTGVALADLDGDGTLDLVAMTGGSVNKVAVLKGLGDGTFGARWEVASGMLGPGRTCAVSADFNGDAMPDLAVAQGLTLYLGTASCP